MEIPSEFDEIRPYEPEELPAAFDKLATDPEFKAVVLSAIPGADWDSLVKQMKACKTSLEFQKTFFYPFVGQLVEKHAKCLVLDNADVLDKSKRYTFISNHRDIVTDPAYLSRLLLENGFETTCEIAIGDNLLIRPWITVLVKLCKTFCVKRGVSMREMLAASQKMSRYMHFVINQKHDNIWIAQREGRAKDSNDHTQDSILKMMVMGGDGSLVDRLKNLNIVPLSISYEFDPCDYLKAREFQLKRDDAGYKKTKEEDYLNMQTGITGDKGHIHFHIAPCINDWLDTLDSNMPKKEFFETVATHIDNEIFKGYTIYPSNEISADMLDDSTEGGFNVGEMNEFEAYLQKRIDLIDLPNKDIPFLRRQILTMYANPYLNYCKAWNKPLWVKAEDIV